MTVHHCIMVVMKFTTQEGNKVSSFKHFKMFLLTLMNHEVGIIMLYEIKETSKCFSNLRVDRINLS